MFLTRAALRIILLMEEGRNWRDDIDDMESDAIFVSATFLSFAGMMMVGVMGVIGAKIGPELLGLASISTDWAKILLFVPFFGMVLGISQGIAFRVLHVLRPRESGWYWWPTNVKVIVTLVELGSLVGTCLLFVYVY